MLSLFLLFGLEGETLKYVCIAVGAVALLLIVLAIVVGVRSRKKNKPLKSTQATQQPQPAEEPIETVSQPVEEEPALAVEEPEVEEEPAHEAQEPEVEEEPALAVEEHEEEEEHPPIPEEKDDDRDDINDDKEEDEQVRKVRRIDGHVRYIIIKYNKSFTAKIIQSSDEVKAYYSEIKNELLSYKGVKSRMSWKGETFYAGRVTYAKLCVRGKCLSLFLALNPKD